MLEALLLDKNCRERSTDPTTINIKIIVESVTVLTPLDCFIIISIPPLSGI